MTGKPIVLLSMQRSGTNFLRRVMGSHPDIDPMFGEIFDPAYIGREDCFFNFLRREVKSDADNCLPDRRIDIFERYIAFLESVHEGRFVLDIKYTSLQHLDGYWLSPGHELIRLILRKGWPIVHLVREDTFAAEVSNFRARVTNEYIVTDTGQKPKDVKFRVEPGEMKVAVGFRNDLVRRYVRRFTDDLATTITFAELTNAENGLNMDVVRSIGERCGVDSAGFSDEIPTKKLITKPLSDVVENYDEVVAALRSAGIPLEMPVASLRQ